jgi:ABC-type transporter Mla MlaB component
MTCKISQINEQNGGSGKHILQVEGKLRLQDAEILEETFYELQKTTQQIEISLSEISFLDSESAAVLTRLKKQGAALTGLDFFIQKVIELAELPANIEENNL